MAVLATVLFAGVFLALALAILDVPRDAMDADLQSTEGTES